MSTSKKVLLSLFAVEALLVGAFVYFSIQNMKKAEAKPSAIIRLHNAKGDFVCSGTVVNSTTIITAAHCLAGGSPLGFLALPTFEVRPSNNQSLGILGIFAGYSPQADQAVLTGDFHAFDTRRVVTDPATIIKKFEDGKNLITCGYPYGGKLFCNPINNPSQFLFQFKAKGYLYPGMSGGPVIDLDTGDVIAVNTAVFEYNDLEGTYLILSPTTEIFANTDTTHLVTK